MLTQRTKYIISHHSKTQVGRAFASHAGDRSSIPSCDRPTCT